MTVRFLAGGDGRWPIDRVVAVTGEDLPRAERLLIVHGDYDSFSNREPVAWAITAFTSNERYVERAEWAILSASQEPLERPEATCAAMLPVRKSDAWWDLPQDERRTIREDRSHHIRIGLDYLPVIARRLYHCRDLGEPFDYVTWFECARRCVGRLHRRRQGHPGEAGRGHQGGRGDDRRSTGPTTTTVAPPTTVAGAPVTTTTTLPTPTADRTNVARLSGGTPADIGKGCRRRPRPA